MALPWWRALSLPIQSARVGVEGAGGSGVTAGAVDGEGADGGGRRRGFGGGGCVGLQDEAGAGFDERGGVGGEQDGGDGAGQRGVGIGFGWGRFSRVEVKQNVWNEQ